jgi:tetratricopeptide (TPR) repeat protein
VKPARAPIGVALMAKDAQATLGTCLDSLRPFVSQIVVGVDTYTTDKTAKVARKHGADAVFDLKVSDWHECEQHGRVLAQHFADARNETFKRLDPKLPWWMWIDSDDFLKGGENLPVLLGKIPPQCVGAWLNYAYATVNGGQAITTLFDRERILRSSVGWEWEHRVHETVKPLKNGPWYRDLSVSVFHQEGVHKTVHSTDRNQLLLEIDIEERGEDPRTTFYLANGHYAAGRFAEAVRWWERTTEIGENPYENWQSFCYMAQAYRRLGDLDNATRAAFCAIDLIPTLKQPYFELAHVYLAAGQYEKTLHWDAVARTKEEPPPFVFVNPVDETYNARMAVADALAEMYRIKEARVVLEEAAQAVPNEHVAARIERYRALEAAQEQANAFVVMARGKSDEEIIALWETANLPDDVKAFGRVRDVVMPCYLRQREREAA